jgi:hypothetical protein
MSAALSPSVTITLTRRSAPAGGLAPFADTPPAAQAAQAAFALLDQVCAAAATAVGAANFGPFANSGSCDYDCGFMEQDWSWNADYTVWTKTDYLLPAIAQVDCSAGFGNAFAPTAAWLANTLPTAAAALSAAVSTIVSIDAVIVAAGGDATPQQLQDLAQAFTQALETVGGAAAPVDGAIQTLASFLNYESGYPQYLQTQATWCAGQITTAINAAAENLIGQIACGGDDVQGQFNGMQATISASFTALQTPFGTASGQLSAALQAAGLITGVLVNLQTDLAAIAAQIGDAQGCAPTSPLRTLHLNIVTSDWTDLQTYAQQQLA